MGTMEDQIRKIVREEIARALSAAGEVAGNADTYDTDHIEAVALMSISRTMERVARDVRANTHPALETEHAPDDACTCGHDRYRHRSGACFACSCPGFTVHTASTETVHTITAVPERPKAACTCRRHTHVLGHDDRCGAPFCYCLSPVRARPEHEGHTVLGGRCLTCTGARNPVSDRLCPCGHYRHTAGDCSGVTGQGTPFAAPCECEYGGRCPCTIESDSPLNPSSPHLCACGHYRHASGECECGGRS